MLRNLATIVVAVLCALNSAADASVLVTNVGSGSLRDGYTGNAIYAGALGGEFTVGAKPEVVTALGYFDGPNSATGAIGDGLLQSHEVGIYTTSGAIVAGLDLTVPAGGGTLVGDFRYVNVGTPVTLAANTSYVIAGQVTTADQNATGDVFLDQSAAQTFASAFTMNSARFTGTASGNGSFNNGVFAYPADTGNAGQIYLGPNFQFTAVTPEPSSCLLGSLGAICLIIAARGRSQSRRA